jgi:hypothetical protein
LLVVRTGQTKGASNLDFVAALIAFVGEWKTMSDTVNTALSISFFLYRHLWAVSSSYVSWTQKSRQIKGE